mgnify:CR=1 FL=1
MTSKLQLSVYLNETARVDDMPLHELIVRRLLHSGIAGASVMRGIMGYGENVDVPTIDLISEEKNVIGNLVGSYDDLCELMALAARGAVTLHTQKYALDDFATAIADLDAGRVRGRAILVP